ncbi:hypothetical protein FA13DRAFT_1726947 [Coprinellus micaceus]|uniref:Uncharacterized protein n=1 Tax=Coprinellus micaceus TaxID=71717 RepID=A0A4Y7TSL7_COPMI|nr:hypothetical protein FA13DRAFT_1726947 [Coprinellus micaceus]
MEVVAMRDLDEPWQPAPNHLRRSGQCWDDSKPHKSADEAKMSTRARLSCRK